jgi:hypothetical protein
MLSHLSSKFNLGLQEQTHEPRAALFLNRFTRTLTVMYATSGIEHIIGIPGEAMKGRSFYYCIQENCLEDAVRCLESAKGNDSIAYLRFWFRDPRQDDRQSPTSGSEDDAEMTDADASETDDDGTSATTSPAQSSSADYHPTHINDSRTNSGSSYNPAHSTEAIFDEPSNPHSLASSIASPAASASSHNDPIELEAVVSCTSDGLVVCLRRARPMIPSTAAQLPTAAAQIQLQYRNGTFAAPWAPEPMFLPPLPTVPPFPLGAVHPAMNAPWQNAGMGPSQIDFMNSIRDVAVFAWALTGINGSLADYSRGKPVGESQPPEGFPVWQPEGFGTEEGRFGGAYDGMGGGGGGRLSATPSGYHSRSCESGTSGSVAGTGSIYPFGDPGLSGSRRLNNNGSQ